MTVERGTAERGTAERAQRVLIVEARFYEDIADELVRGAAQVFEAAGVTWERMAVPGSFEVPTAVHFAIRAMQRDPINYHYDGFIAFGCVIRGETSHYDYICLESARGVQELALRYDVAIGYGILTVENREQAWERAAIERRNKGADVARACLRMIELRRHFQLDR